MKNLKKKKIKKINFPTKAVLDYLKETSKGLLDLSIDIIINPGGIMRDAGFYSNYPSLVSFIPTWESKIESNSSFERKNGKIYLTNKGRIKIIKNIIKDRGNNKKWDGKWRAIVFDIPEATRRERNFLRKELKQVGFKELQKSIWIYPYDIKKEMLALLKLWKTDFTGDIRFFEINKIEEDKDLKKHFKL